MPDLAEPVKATTSKPPSTTTEPNKLILCFDGTGNTFSGSNADTNVVKILNKLDRQNPKQFHYYQTGVGTYDVYETMSVHKSFIGSIRSNISRTIDQAFGTTFDAHVMAGYRFLMRYYTTGSKIYMFGFSRGAYTAKFLARMVNKVGLLCKGNEEMVPFAYRLYQRYLEGEIEDYKYAARTENLAPMEEQSLLRLQEDGTEANVEDYHGDTYESANNEIEAFSNTFCRKETDEGSKKEVNVKVYFLGIWDCVNSVAVLEGAAPLPTSVSGTAKFVRHAVAVDERRVKFKPALLAQDIRCSGEAEDLKEVWFPGCHGDIGGGWPAGEDDDHHDSTTATSTTFTVAATANGTSAAKAKELTFWQRVKSFWKTTKPTGATKDVCHDAFQLSDVPLAWMIRELELVGQLDPTAEVKWSRNRRGYKSAYDLQDEKKQALGGFIHDSLRFGTGTGFFTVLLWKFMEILPTISRWELKGDKWDMVRFPLNRGSSRDIPPDAVLHESLVYRLNHDKLYRPNNNHGGDLEPCLKHKDKVPQLYKIKDYEPDHKLYDAKHQTYQFKDPAAIQLVVQSMRSGRRFSTVA